MWLADAIIEAVDKVATVRYINKTYCDQWNQTRREGELRLLTGWEWIARNSNDHCQGFKTITVCYINAYYALVKHAAAPSLGRGNLRVIAGGRKRA